MFDMTSLPVSGGVIAAGLTWAALSGFVLGPLVAERTILKSGWQATCEQSLQAASTVRQHPQNTPTPDISCDQMMGLFGHGADALCAQGGDLLFDLLNADPLAAQKEQLRQREEDRLARIATLAPTRCSCATSIVRADRMGWGLHAGTARLVDGPDNLQAELTQALHSPVCALNVGI